jgi:hypothetical protein
LAESQQNKAFRWLAFSSALLVLLASGVAISRLGDDGGDSRVASAPTPGPTGVDDGSGQAGSGEAGAGGGTASGPGAGGASDANAAADSAGAATGVGAPTARTAGGTPTDGSGGANGLSGGTSGAGGTAGGTSPAGGTAGGTSPAGTTAGGGQPDGASGGTEGEPGQDGGQQPGPGGGQDSPPAPSQDPPEQDSRLVAASASAGEGAQGGVAAVAVDGTDLDVDLTLGRDQLVGNHPPSDGTGVSFGGRLLNPPSVSPAFPTVSG